MKLENVRIKWTSGAACPEGISINRIYNLVKKDEKLYFTDGEIEIQIEEDALKNIFTPMDCNWEDIVFDEVKIKKVNNK